jgi:hypothetical protein
MESIKESWIYFLVRFIFTGRVMNTYHTNNFCNKKWIYTTGATCEAGTFHPSEAPEITPG